MKQFICKRIVIAGFVLLAIPSFVLAQSTQEKREKKERMEKKEKIKKDKEVQTIVITRKGDKDEKIVIEMEEGKIKINGKDVKDLKELENLDIDVNVNTNQGGRSFYRVAPGSGAHAWTFNDQQMSLFDEDENRAMLGVNTDDHAKGAEIQSVTEGSAAEKAGLKKGDVITKVGDTKIENASSLSDVIHDHKPGDKIDISYLRENKNHKVTAELGKWRGIRINSVNIPNMEQLMENWKHIEPLRAPGAFGGQNFYFSGKPRLGISIQDTEDGKGVKILEVEDESSAAKAGLQKDDIILAIDDSKIEGTDDVMEVIREDEDKYDYTFKVQRSGKMVDVKVRFPKKLKQADL